MTLPLDVPTAKPPGDLAPAQELSPFPPPGDLLAAPALPPTPQLPTAPTPLPPPDPVQQIADTVAPAVVQALKDADPYAYFAMLLRTDPSLFYKWAAMLTGARNSRQGNAQQMVVNVVTAIPKSPLDELPPGFSING